MEVKKIKRQEERAATPPTRKTPPRKTAKIVNIRAGRLRLKLQAVLVRYIAAAGRKELEAEQVQAGGADVHNLRDAAAACELLYTIAKEDGNDERQ